MDFIYNLSKSSYRAHSVLSMAENDSLCLAQHLAVVALNDLQQRDNTGMDVTLELFVFVLHLF